MWTATNRCDNALYYNAPPSGGEGGGGWMLAIACDLLGFLQVETQCWHFQRLFRKCTKEFHSTLAKSTFTTCLWHQSYTMVSLYTTVAATDHSEAGYTNVSYSLVSTLDRMGSKRAHLTSNNTITAQCCQTLCAEHYSEASSFFLFFFFTIHELTWHLGTKSQPSSFKFLRFSCTTYSRCFDISGSRIDR